MSDHLIKSDFEPANQARWLDAVDKALKGASIDSLNSIEPGGLARRPLYTPQDQAKFASGFAGQFPFTRAAHVAHDPHLPWQIAQRIIPGRKGSDNASILTDLIGGVSALTLDLSTASPPTAEALDTLFSGVMLDIIMLNLTPGAHIAQSRDLLDHLYGAQNIAPDQRRAYINADPIGAAARHNKPVTSEALDDLNTLFDWGTGFPHIKLFCADGRVFHDSGASEAQELGCMAAQMVALSRAFTSSGAANGVPIEDFFNRMTLGLAADVDFFATIAKMRAARAIWSRVTQTCGSAACTPTLIVDTSERCFATADPWVNILRATISALGAALGGSDVLTVAPCTATSAGDNSLSRRIARNTQIILQEESHFGHVVDPAGGAWYVENLTADLIAAAWQFFQAIEAQGGLTAAIASGWLAEQIGQSRQTRQDAINSRAMARIGVNEFPNLDEAPLVTRAPYGSGALAEQRDMEAFEKLRAAAEPSKPTVFLATLGRQAEFSARVNFASNLYAVAGVHSQTGEGGEDINAIVEAYRASGCKIACLCASDAAYDSHGEALATELKQAGATHIALAGKTRAMAHIDDYCFTGCDTFAFSQSVHRVLGLEG